MNHDEAGGGMIPPAKLAKSFLLVAGCYIFFFATTLGTFIALAKVFFPVVFEQLENPETIQETLKHNPEMIFPRGLYWPWVAINAFVCLCLGWTVARLAPFGKFPHALFLAILIFVGCLQQAIAAPNTTQWMFVLMMGILPISILSGARLAISGSENEVDDSNPERA